MALILISLFQNARDDGSDEADGGEPPENFVSLHVYLRGMLLLGI